MLLIALAFPSAADAQTIPNQPPSGQPEITIAPSASDLCGDAPYSELQQAVSCAQAGAALLLAHAEYHGGAVIDRELTICLIDGSGGGCADGPAKAWINGDGAETVVTVRADNVTLQNLLLRNPSYSDTGEVEPTLLDVDGRSFTGRLLELMQPAAALGSGEWRAGTYGYRIRPGSHEAFLFLVSSYLMPSSLGPVATCPQSERCRTIAGQILDSDDAWIRGGLLDIRDADPAVALEVTGDRLRFQNANLLTTPLYDGGKGETILLKGPSSHAAREWTVLRNWFHVEPSSLFNMNDAEATMAPGTTGIKATLADSTVSNGTRFTGIGTAIDLVPNDEGGNVLDRMFIHDSDTAIRLGEPHSQVTTVRLTRPGTALEVVPNGDGTAGSDIRMDWEILSEDGEVGAPSGPLAPDVLIHLLPGVTEAAIDATFNDWGVYSENEIAGRIWDEGARNRVDVTCWLQPDGEHNCPPPVQLSFEAGSATSGQHSDTAALSAKLTSPADDPIESAELSFELSDGESTRVFPAVTDDEGIAAIRPTLEEKPGAYQLSIHFAGNETYGSATTTSSFIITREDSSLTLDITGNGASRLLHARLVDADGSAGPIGGASVVFFSDGEFIGTATTDKDGLASFDPARGDQGGKHVFEAHFEGNQLFHESTDQQAT